MKKIYSLIFSSSSKSLADGLTHRGLIYRESAESTEKFIRMCNQLFDFLNVCNTLGGQMKRKPALDSYIDRNEGIF